MPLVNVASTAQLVAMKTEASERLAKHITNPILERDLVQSRACSLIWLSRFSDLSGDWSPVPYQRYSFGGRESAPLEPKRERVRRDGLSAPGVPDMLFGTSYDDIRPPEGSGGALRPNGFGSRPDRARSFPHITSPSVGSEFAPHGADARGCNHAPRVTAKRPPEGETFPSSASALVALPTRADSVPLPAAPRPPVPRRDPRGVRPATHRARTSFTCRTKCSSMPPIPKKPG